MKKIIGVLVFLLLSSVHIFAYTPNKEEIKMLFHIEDVVRALSEEGGKEKLYTVRKNVFSYQKILHGVQYDFFFTHILSILNKYIEKHEGEVKKELKENENARIIKTVIKAPVAQNKEKISLNIVSFYNKYKKYLTSDILPSNLCIKYYDQIDEIAKEYNFPTSLIIATRYREHTCIFKNPSNSRGNFQITTAYYKPGPITREQFRQQVIDFIQFSKKKRLRYEKFWKFDKIPVTLSYTQMDLLSVQKHSILYNGMRKGSTPQNNFYANQNFNQEQSGRDGIVAMSLKIIGRALEKNEKEINLKKQVLKKKVGEKKTCELYFTENLEKGDRKDEVKKIQSFLKKQGFFNHDITGYYGNLTESAVNAFQAYYKKYVLNPGGYTKPTGNRFSSTRKKANQIWCVANN